jgi:hypothetical protein
MTAMSKAAILRGMREATERRKRHERTRTARAMAESARARFDALSARLDALDTRVEVARIDPLAAAAERARRLWPHRADMERERGRLRDDVLAAVIDQPHEFEWSPA